MVVLIESVVLDIICSTANYFTYLGYASCYLYNIFSNTIFFQLLSRLCYSNFQRTMLFFILLP